MQFKRSESTLWKSDTFRVHKMETMNIETEDALRLIRDCQVFVHRTAAAEYGRAIKAPYALMSELLQAEINLLEAASRQRAAVEGLLAWYRKETLGQEVQS